MVDTITGATPRYTRRRRAQMRAAWVAARARNTLRHPMRLAALCATVFVAALVLLILAPRSARRASEEIAPLSAQWRDTVPLIQVFDSTQRRLAVAESTLSARRALAARPVYVPRPIDTLPPETRARRSALEAAGSELTRLLERADNSPLPQSYRALGESAVLRTDPQVRVLLDSLTEIEREREELGAAGGVDPIFVALTARATALGRSIQRIAEQRRAAIRDTLRTLQPPPPPPPVLVRVDTMTPMNRRDAARADHEAAIGALDAARRENAEIERRLRAARAQANVLAPPVAILAAALVIGCMLGFALALFIELWRPRLSDMQEAERVTGARAIAVIRPRVIPPERARRRADRNLPPLLDPTSDAYRLLASHTSVAGATGAVVTIAGDDPAVTATIAANIGAVSSNDARGTLLIDSDLVDRPVTSVLRLRRVAGLSAVLDRTRDLAAAAVQAPVGRDRWLDVVPAGPHRRGPLIPAEAVLLRQEIARVARHYDLTLVSAALAHAPMLHAAPAVMLCAHVAHTPIDTLRAGVAALRDRGAQIIGIVLWEAEAPNLDPPWTLEGWFTLGERGTPDEHLVAVER